jgi:hypothetical protein
MRNNIPEKKKKLEKTFWEEEKEREKKKREVTSVTLRRNLDPNRRVYELNHLRGSSQSAFGDSYPQTVFI